MVADREMTVLQVGREGAKQMDDVGKWRDDVRSRTLGKQWAEYARHAWDISPTLAAVLVSEVSRLVRAAPTKVCHIPQAVDFFLSEEMLEKDSPELPHLLTWAPCSPLRALSLFCKRTL